MKSPTILLRRLHKWVGLALGAQLLLWTLSGSAMALLDMEAVAGGKVARTPAPPPLTGPVARLAAVERMSAGSVTGFTLRPQGDGWVYEVRTAGGAVRLLEAAGAGVLQVGEPEARRLAAQHYAGGGGVQEVRRLSRPDLETRDHEGPLWRVDFADREHTAVYVSAETGRVLEHRTDAYRLWDLFWMIHIMDYPDRRSFNHPLIWVFAAAALWLAVTGTTLAVLSVRSLVARRA